MNIPDLREKILYLQNNGLTQKEIGVLIGLGQSSISEFLNNKCRDMAFSNGCRLLELYEKIKEKNNKNQQVD